MSYVDAFWDRDNDVVHVSERHPTKGRILLEYRPNYTFYYPDPKGKYTSLFGSPLNKISCKTFKDFQKEQRIFSAHRLFESDINQVFRTLEEHYIGQQAPQLQVAFFDIETDMQPYAYPNGHVVKLRSRSTQEVTEVNIFTLGQMPGKDLYDIYDDSTRKWVPILGCKYLEPGPGYSSTEDARMPITSIAVHLQWMDTLVCLAIPPCTMTVEQARAAVSDIPNTFIFDTESEMLSTFLTLIDDADVISGWNSESFDIPYIVNRVRKILGKDETRKFSLWDKLPSKREFERYGKVSSTYDFVGRVHLDYLELYRKFTYEEQLSYRLDAIGEIEVGENKVPYDGTLDQLYNSDFRKFIEYNRQDTALLDKLDKKLKYIDLANVIAHDSTVLLQTTLGAVAVVEQAIVNRSHQLGLIVPSRPQRVDSEDLKAAGAYVAYPKKGLHKSIGSLDINSLYPSTIRALNMGPETIVGQIRHDYTDREIQQKLRENGNKFAQAWEGKFACNEYEYVMDQDTEFPLVIDWEDGRTETMTGDQVYHYIFGGDRNLMISANGTIFSHENEGIIPGLLAAWYAERKSLQAELRAAHELNPENAGIPVTAEFIMNVKSATAIAKSTKALKPREIAGAIENCDYDTVLKMIQDGLLAFNSAGTLIQYADKDYCDKQLEFWDKRQHAKKILLNSLYGALLNQGCRFFDKRIGQSTTLTGRQIVRHMTAEVDRLITGEGDYLGKSIIYNDSVVGSTLINTDNGMLTIEELFDACSPIDTHNPKEYAVSPDIRVLGYNAHTKTSQYFNFKYVMRHGTTKELFNIVLDNGLEVTATADHSVMVLRDGILTQMKPEQLLQSDEFICSSTEGRTESAKIVDVTRIGLVDDYVYDISVNDDNPYFFGNGILLHNTDSVIGSTLQQTNRGELSIEELFASCQDFEIDEKTGKEYGYDSDLMVMSYDPLIDQPYLGHINYIYRHKVSKALYEIEDASGNKVTVTEDHSIMVERDGELIEVSPADLIEDDVIITLMVSDTK